MKYAAPYLSALFLFRVYLQKQQVKMQKQHAALSSDFAEQEGICRHKLSIQQEKTDIGMCI